MMERVVNESGGTGTAAAIPGITVAGKTGTAENVPGQPTHAWFISFAPANDPKIAVAVLVEHGGVGGTAAAPIARSVHVRGAAGSCPMMEPACPANDRRIFGERYVLGERLTAGETREVWRAHDDIVSRAGRAQDLLRSAGRRPGVAAARSVDDADRLVALSHPGIAKVYDHGESDDETWLAMAFVAGRAARRPARPTPPLGAGRGARPRRPDRARTCRPPTTSASRTATLDAGQPMIRAGGVVSPRSGSRSAATRTPGRRPACARRLAKRCLDTGAGNRGCRPTSTSS